MSALGPGCVKTCTSGECAELFSLFSSFDGDCQSGSFLIQRNRDKLSTRKPDVGVFTQSGTRLGHPPASHVAVAKPVSPLSKCSSEPLRCQLPSLEADMRRREFP